MLPGVLQGGVMKRRSSRGSSRQERLVIRTAMVTRGDDGGGAIASRWSSAQTGSLWTALGSPTLGDPPDARDPLTGTVSTDVCVIGLGIAGLTAAISLARQGASVVGLDAGAIGGRASMASAGSWMAGLPLMHHDAIEILGRERATALYNLTRRELAALQVDSSTFSRWGGSLRIAHSKVEEADCARQLHIMRRDGLPVEAYDGPEGRGLLFPEDGAYRPTDYAQQLVNEAVEAGVTLYGFTRALQIGERDPESVDGEVRCRAVIIAVDGGLDAMVPALNGAVWTGRTVALATAPTVANSGTPDEAVDLPSPADLLPPPPTSAPPSDPPPAPPSTQPAASPSGPLSASSSGPPSASSSDPPSTDDLSIEALPAAADDGPPPPPTVPPTVPPTIERPTSVPTPRLAARTRWGRDGWVVFDDGRVVTYGLDDGRDDLRVGAIGDDEGLAHLTRLAHDVAGTQPAVQQQWQAACGFTEDRLPIIAKIGSGTVVVGGYNGFGGVLAPMLGRAAADLALGKPSALADLLTGDGTADG